MRDTFRNSGVWIVLACAALTNTFGQKTESAAEKAKREQLEQQRAAVIAENERITRSNETVAQAFAGGNAALAAKNYDAAIAEYNKGIAADPKHPGLSSLHTNKSLALRWRGAAEYNAAVQLSDVSLKETRLEAARKDFRLALNAANDALRVFDLQPKPVSPAGMATYKANKYTVMINRAEAYKVFVSKVDKLQADAALSAYKEYWLVEESAPKRIKTQIDVGQMLFDIGQFLPAASEFKVVLASDPANVDPLFGAGVSFFAAKNNYKEGISYIQRFLELAPTGDSRRQNAGEVLAFMKSELGL